MDQVQSLEPQQAPLLPRLQIGRHLVRNDPPESVSQYPFLGLDLVAGAEHQELDNGIEDRGAQMHEGIALQTVEDDAPVFFLLPLAGESAQLPKMAAGAPQPGI